MIRTRQVTLNTLAAAAQVVVTGLVFVVLYRFVKDMLGMERFGVWAVVLVAATISNLANLGLGSSVVKFVSMHLARDNPGRAGDVVQTSFITLALVLAGVLGLLYPVATWALSMHSELSVSPALLAEAYAILPYAFASFWMVSLGSVTLGAIDGHQRIDIRSAIQVACALLYLAAAFVLVPRYGLLGLAWAHITQAGLVLCASWIAIRKLLPSLPLVPCRWRFGVLREILGYSLKFQVVAIFRLLFEPLTRWLVSDLGSLASAGHFEYAYRMVFQLRALVATAHQSLVPTIADLKERQAALLKEVYVQSMRVVLFLVLLGLPLLVVATPLISRLWLGSFEAEFIAYAVLLALGWFLNLLSNPAYFAYMGIGTLRWNVTGHIVIGVLNAGLGYALGLAFGGTGVIAGFVVALVAGSCVTAVAYQREYGISLASVLEKSSLFLGALGIASTAALAFVLHATMGSLWVATLAPVVLLLALALPALRHPVRQDLGQWIGALRQPV